MSENKDLEKTELTYAEFLRKVFPKSSEDMLMTEEKDMKKELDLSGNTIGLMQS
jgi:hypothetical protein